MLKITLKSTSNFNNFTMKHEESMFHITFNMKNRKSQKTENFRFWVPSRDICELNPDNFLNQYSIVYRKAYRLLAKFL